MHLRLVDTLVTLLRIINTLSIDIVIRTDSLFLRFVYTRILVRILVRVLMRLNNYFIFFVLFVVLHIALNNFVLLLFMSFIIWYLLIFLNNLRDVMDITDIIDFLYLVAVEEGRAGWNNIVLILQVELLYRLFLKLTHP